MLNVILISFSIVLIILGSLWRRHNKRHLKDLTDNTSEKRFRRFNIIAIVMTAAGIIILLIRLIDIVFGPAEGSLDHVSIWPDRMDVLGLSVSVTVVYSWVIMAVLIFAAAVIRLTVFSRPTDTPKGLQNVIETIVEAVSNYTKAQAHGTGELLCSYILTIAVFLVSCAFLELFRLRAPTSDISITFSLALLTFILINVYGIKRKGVRGRIKSIASPTPLVFPFRLISEIAIPVSLACRLFGNMLGGMIVVDLLYNALGNNSAGIIGVLGLWFNIFHPLIQAFIFVTLTLTFTNEAIE